MPSVTHGILAWGTQGSPLQLCARKEVVEGCEELFVFFTDLFNKIVVKQLAEVLLLFPPHDLFRVFLDWTLELMFKQGQL